MWKSLNRLLFSGLAFVLTIVAMANVEAASMFMMYEPEPPKVTKTQTGKNRRHVCL